MISNFTYLKIMEDATRQKMEEGVITEEEFVNFYEQICDFSAEDAFNSFEDC